MHSPTSTISQYCIEILKYDTSSTVSKSPASILSLIIQVAAIRPTRSLLQFTMRSEIIAVILCAAHIYAAETSTQAGTCAPSDAPTTETPIGCVCGVFLSGQFKKGSKEQPKGNPALLHEHPDTFPCSIVGNKLCTNKCLDTIVKHLPNSPAILCGSIDRDCHKERAYLFIKNCKDEWMNTNLSAGREYCCKDGMPYKCPILS